MLISGWILPDLHEVTCKSCSTLNGHIEIVLRYLGNLMVTDEAVYNKVIQTFHDARTVYPHLEVDDFAVMCLGWIKVINYPMKVIFYTRGHKLEFALQKHINWGYTPVILDKIKPYYDVNIPSVKLI